MAARMIGVRLPPDDHRWITELARRNQIPVSSMVRAVLHGVRIMATEGKIDALSMGELHFGRERD